MKQRMILKVLLSVTAMWVSAQAAAQSPASRQSPAKTSSATGGGIDFPLTLKTKWTYHLRQELGPGVHFGEIDAKLAHGNVLDTTVVSEAVGKDSINGQNYVRFESKRNGNPWLTEWYRLSPEGLLLGKTLNWDEGGQEVIMAPPQKLLSRSMRAGETWNWKASQAPVSIRVRVLEPSTVNVPAGAFHAIQTVHEMTIQTPEGIVVQVNQKRWYVEGMGYLKQETRTMAGNRFLSHVLLTLEKFEAVK